MRKPKISNKYPPRLLVLLCIKRHLSPEAYQNLLADLKAHGGFQFKTMGKIIARYFDIEQLAQNPMDIGDSWVYNYLILRKAKFFKMEEVIALFENNYAPPAGSRYQVHMRYKEIMDVIRNIAPKPAKRKAAEQTPQLKLF